MFLTSIEELRAPVSALATMFSIPQSGRSIGSLQPIICNSALLMLG